MKNLNLKLIDISEELKIQGALPAFNEDLDKTICKAIRILPTKTMEGFFVSKFMKL